MGSLILEVYYLMPPAFRKHILVYLP